MVAKRSPDWLPDGWAVQFRLQKRGRKIEFYTNLETGKNFFSKDDVIRYIKMASTHSEKPQPTTLHIQNHSEEIHSQFEGDPTEYPEWLPKGWKVELRIRKTGVHVGKEYKCYIDPSTEYTFYSKPEVFRYLETLKRKSCKSRKLKAVSLERCITKKKVITPVQADVEREDVEDLPPGWIKETKVRKCANRLRRDPYYIDPVNGYVFRSKRDVYHYLETGEISRYAFKPKNMCTDDQEVADDEIAPSSAIKGQKFESVTRQQHFGGKGNSEMSSLEIPETETSSQLQDKEVSTETGFAHASTADVVQGKHLTENKVEECAKTEGDCSPSRSAQPESELSDRHEGNKSWLEVEGSVIDPSNIGEAQLDSKKLKNKGKLNLPRRCSKRLAGVAPGRHLTENKVEDRAKNKEDCSPNRPTQPKPEPSDRHEGKRSMCKVETSVVHPGFAGNELVCTPAADTLNENSPKTMMEKNVVREAQIDSSQLKNKGKLKLPHRSSKRLAGVPPEKHLIDNVDEKCAKTKVGCSPKRSTEPEAELSDRHEGERSLLEVEGSVIDPGNMNCSSNEPVSTPAVDTLNETVMGNSDIREADADSRKLNKVKMPRRSSKRLAGVELKQVAQSASSEGALQSATGKSRKNHASQGAGLASDQFVNKASQQLGAASAAEVAHHILTDRNSASHKEPLNNGKMPVDEQFVLKEQQQILETEKKDTEKQEPRLSFLFGSDPCLEFAFKTLTGELPISSTVEKGPILNFAPKTENSLESGMENSCSKKPRANKSKTNKELKLSHQSSKRLAGVESERLANTISSEQALQNAPGKSFTSKKAIPAVDSENEVSRQLEFVPEKLANHPCTTTMYTARQEELSDKSKKSLEEQAVPQEEPQKFESQKVEAQNPEPQFPFPFMDSWSDPCLDFAFKTLTGAIPIEDDLLHGYFHERLISHNHRDGLALPDFGPPGFFQNDISPQFDAPEQSVSGQQFPMNSSFCSSGNVSMANCNGVGSSQQPSMNPSLFQPGNASLSNSAGAASSQQQPSMNYPFQHAGNVSMSNCSGFDSVQQVPLNSSFLPAANVSMSNFRGYDSVQQLPTNSLFLPAGHVSVSNCSSSGVGLGQQLTTNNSPFLAAGNVSLSNCSAVSLPTPCIGGTKDSHGKVES